MGYVIICPACSENVRAGEVCECGYSHLDAAGQPYTRRHEGEPWQPEPNILVVYEGPALPVTDPAPEDTIEESPAPKEEEDEEE